jgi:transposase
MKIPKSDIERFQKLDFSVKAVIKRRDRMNTKRILSRKQESITAGWIIYRCSLKQSTTTTKLREFINRSFNRNVSSFWISSFMKRRHLSLQDPSTAKGSEMMEVKYQEAVKCLKELRSLNKNPNQIAVMDKTKFYNDSRRVKHVAIKGAGDLENVRIPEVLHFACTPFLLQTAQWVHFI